MIHKFFHGGIKWLGSPTINPKRRRYEHGPGIYLTTSYETARKYGKGSRAVFEVDVQDFTCISEIKIPKLDLLRFIEELRPKNWENICTDLEGYANRTGREDIPLNVLNNLVVNWEAGGGKSGASIAQFFTENGADALIEQRGGGELVR